jgi:hypothetical protein
MPVDIISVDSSDWRETRVGIAGHFAGVGKADFVHNLL